MRIHIEQIKEEGLSLEFEKSTETFPVLAEMAANSECEFTAPISGGFRAQRIGDMVEVEGKIETSVCLSCSRCLQPFEASLKSHFAVTFIQQTADHTIGTEAEEIELNVEDLGLVHFQGEKINLIDTIQEHVIMEFPLRALCKSDCKGLCATCGADLNQDLCDCSQKPSPGKFAVLKELKLEK